MTGSCVRAAVPFLLLLLLISGGCSLHSGVLPPAPGQSERVDIREVPFYPQEEYLCGPAALAMALTWSGQLTAPDDLVDSVYTPGKKGSFQSEMVSAARRQGRIAYPFKGQEQLVAELAAGNPAVVLQNLALSWFPQWHYAVAVGYDRPANEVILNTGVHERRRESFRVFENTWGRSEFWGLLVLPPDRLPAMAEEGAWLKAAVGLERAKAVAEAHTAYVTAANRWPQSHDAWMGVGNTAYALGDMAASEAAFRRATGIRPDDGIAFNNLAHVLAESGRRDEAVDAAKKAIAIGGPQLDVFRRTLSEVE